MDVETIKAEYFRIRGQGRDARAALTELRPYIVKLEMRQREKLLEQLRVWEISHASGPKSVTADPRAATSAKGKIKPLTGTGMLRAMDSLEPMAPAGATAPVPPVGQSDALKVVCPNCGKRNERDDVFCYSCGQLLAMERGLFDTRHFLDENESYPNEEFYGPNTLLVLTVRATSTTYRVRPQRQRHEFIIGRGAGSTMQPDIDLQEEQGGKLGVSRMHVSLAYNEKQRTLQVSDIGSANGTFLNGQRLHPGEIRVLRSGDELRLGRLLIDVIFEHASEEESRPL